MKKIERLKLRGWAEIDDLRGQIQDFAEQQNIDKVAELIYRVIEVGTQEQQNLAELSWLDVKLLFEEIVVTNQPTIQFPILVKSKKNRQPEAWEYYGRNWYFWLNLFASNYGWSIEQIEQIDIDTAIGLMQEITLDKQFAEEWEWGLSEKSVEYNKNTKKSHFVKLPRPEWMNKSAAQIVKKPVKKIKIRADMLPQGNVVNLDEG